MKSCTSNPDEYGGLLGYKCRQPAHRLEAQTNHLPLYRQEEVRNCLFRLLQILQEAQGDRKS